MATRKQVRTRGRLSFLLGAILATVLFAAVAYADNVQNDVVAGGNDTIVAGGSTTINYRITANSGDGESGCNATALTPATVTINAPAAVSASPGSLSFTSCSVGTTLNSQPVVLSSSTPGNYSITVSVSDLGSGTYNTNSAAFTLHVIAPTDTTAPVITPTIAGTLGSNGWYVSNVSVSWSVTDPQSSFTSTGCGATTINTDTTGTTLTCSATSAGGTSSQSVTIKRDATAPTISGGATSSPNANDWYGGNVSVNFLCDDATSGVSGVCGPDATLNTDGAGQSVTGTVQDAAGNSASATVSGINIDKTAPTITATRTPGANTNGWNNGSVTVHFECSDATSGIDSCSSDVVKMNEGAGQSATGTATDEAGNSATATVNDINIDTTPPVANATASPGPNTYGWNNTNVTVSFTGTDALSGVGSCDVPVLVSSEGTHSVSGICTDMAGNASASSNAVAVKIDKTAPIVSLVGGPAAGGSYYFGSVPATPTCNASDALSGLDGSCSVSGYSAEVGTHTVSASAADKAGNVGSDSQIYTVLAWTLRGFYQPVDMGTGVVNTVKNGSTVPLKFELFAGSNELTALANVTSLTSRQVNCTAFSGDLSDEIELVATGGTSLRYDTTAGQFIYNWKTPTKAGNCYVVTMTADDGSSLSAQFKLK
jgi:hypothetical protein